MPVLAETALFVASLGVTVVAARLFARRLDRLGRRFGLPEALIGLLTALAADGPNVSSALYALIRGAHDVGVGVIAGSNAFQLAAMIGLSALLAGSVVLAREALLLEGIAGMAIMLIAAALLLGWLSPALAVAHDGTSPSDDAIASAWWRREILPIHLRRLLLGAGHA